ncbi:MAG: diguanylate cyclase [candidate division KSB1 bacterium]|nr:diguanylate cyclase [candidate division KSB1 bacterium]
MLRIADRAGLTKDFVLTISFVLLGLAAVNYTLFPNDPGFLTITPNPYLLAVLIGAAQFGLLGGLWSALFASGLVILQSGVLRPPSLGSPFPPSSLLPIVVPNFVAALVIGQLQQLHHGKYQRLRVHHSELEAENYRLKEQLLAVTKVKEELEQRILGQEATLHSLYKALKALEVLEERQVYEGILEVTERFTGANKSSLYVVDYSRDEAVLVASRGWSSSPKGPNQLPLSDPLVRALFGRNEPLTVKEISENPSLHQARKSLGLESLVLVPIYVRGVVLAILSVDDIPFLRLTIPTLRTLRIIAELASPALANVVRFAELEAKDQIDKMTELPNYRYFLESLTHELRRVSRHKLPLTVVAFEIAEADQLQASLSPEAWQLVVRVVGKILRHDLREIDLVCAGRRPGTYWVMLPLTSVDQSLKVVGRLQQRIRASNKLLGLKRAKLDLLFGFAAYRPYVRDAQMLVQLAEQSLDLSRQAKDKPDAADQRRATEERADVA